MKCFSTDNSVQTAEAATEDSIVVKGSRIRAPVFMPLNPFLCLIASNWKAGYTDGRSGAFRVPAFFGVSG